LQPASHFSFSKISGFFFMLKFIIGCPCSFFLSFSRFVSSAFHRFLYSSVTFLFAVIKSFVWSLPRKRWPLVVIFTFYPLPLFLVGCFAKLIAPFLPVSPLLVGINVVTLRPSPALRAALSWFLVTVPSPFFPSGRTREKPFFSQI